MSGCHGNVGAAKQKFQSKGQYPPPTIADIVQALVPYRVSSQIGFLEDMSGEHAMNIHAFVVAFGGIVGAATFAQAQTAAAPADPLTSAQNAAGAIVGEAFHRPDPIVAAVSTPGSPVVTAGVALRTSMEIPGAVFAGALKPLADADMVEAPAAVPVPTPAPRRHRHVRARHLRAPSQG